MLDDNLVVDFVFSSVSSVLLIILFLAYLFFLSVYYFAKSLSQMCIYVCR